MTMVKLTRLRDSLVSFGIYHSAVAAQWAGVAPPPPTFSFRKKRKIATFFVIDLSRNITKSLIQILNFFMRSALYSGLSGKLYLYVFCDNYFVTFALPGSTTPFCAFFSIISDQHCSSGSTSLTVFFNDLKCLRFHGYFRVCI